MAPSPELARKHLKNKKNKVENLPSKGNLDSTTDFYRKQREQYSKADFNYIDNTNPPLREEYALDLITVNKEAAKGLRTLFIAAELYTDDNLDELKEALVVKGTENTFWKLVVGLSEMALDFEGTFRDATIDQYLTNCYKDEGKGIVKEGGALYHDFMLQELKDNRSILETKKSLLHEMSLEVGIDDEYRKRLSRYMNPEKVHDAFFSIPEKSQPHYKVYREGFDYRVW